MIKLFSEQEFKSAKCNTLLPLKCVCCNLCFYRTKHSIINYSNPKQNRTGNFCSKKCLTKIKVPKIECFCKQCGVPTFKTKSAHDRGISHFCSKSCAAQYNNVHRILKQRVKQINPIVKLKVIKLKFCKWCGCTPCSYVSVCKKYRMFPTLINFFNFDSSVVGTTNIYDEYHRIKSLLENDYVINELSTVDLAAIYNHGNMDKILNSFEIKRRTMSESAAVSFLRYPDKCISNYYKQGWHTTWCGDDIFYRSSYELKYAKYLDSEKIQYKFEFLQFKYFDTQRNKIRIAIPDFYLSETNTIVEIKSVWTHDGQNWNDRLVEYKKLNYNVILIMDFVEFKF